MITTHLILFEFFKGVVIPPPPTGDLTHLMPAAIPCGILYGSFAGRDPAGAALPGGARRFSSWKPWAIPIGPTHVRVV